jgi:hypothetical protein
MNSVMQTARPAIQVAIEHSDHFRPSPPTPTWRMKDADELKKFAKA